MSVFNGPVQYAGMGNLEFDFLIDSFRGTTEHTYIAVIKHDGQYYVSRQLMPGSKFAFDSYTVNKGGLFRSSNKALRKEIALQIQNETPFRNTDYNDESIHIPVSLRKMFLFNKGTLFKRTKIAVFLSNEFESESEFVALPFDRYIKDQSDETAVRLLQVLKWDTYWAPFLVSFICFIVFVLLTFNPAEWSGNLDLFAFLYTIITQIRTISNNRKALIRSKIVRKFMPLKNALTSCGIWEFFITFLSLYISHMAYTLHLVDASSSAISKLCIALIFSGVLIDIWVREQ